MKVLNIGLPRTGTYSLSLALGILGYKTKHCPFKIRDIAKYDASCEVRFSYDRLEYLYPNSLYIFTIRDFKYWLLSCKKYREHNKKHFDPHFNSRWNPFWKDPKKWERIYYQRIDEFKNIDPKRMLVLNLNDFDKWNKLCNFLKKPIPKQKYPVKNLSVKKFKIHY